MRRPSVSFLLALCLGIWWVLKDFQPALWIGLVLVLSVLYERNLKKITVLSVGIMLGMGLAVVHVKTLESENSKLEQMQPFQIKGTLYQQDVMDTTTCWLKTESGLWLRLRFSRYAPMPIMVPGSRVQVSGTYMTAEPARNPGGFHEKRWLYAKRATGNVLVKQLKSIGQGSLLETWRHRLGRPLANSLIQNTAFQQGPMAAGMLLGEDAWIPESVIQAYKDSGTNHILSVSGAHFGVLLFWIYKLSENNKCGYWSKKLGIWIVLGLFIWLIGADAAAVRAYIMYVVSDIARMRYKQPDMLNSLCITVIIILLLNPLMIWDIGLQLAFSAMYGLLVLTPFLGNSTVHRTKGCIRKALNGFICSLSVSLCLYPVLCNQFNNFSWWSMIYNIPVAFFSGICLPLSLLVAFLFPVSRVAKMIGIISGAALWLMTETVKSSSLLPKSNSLPSLTALEFSLYAMLLLLPLYFRQVYVAVRYLEVKQHLEKLSFHRLGALLVTFLYVGCLCSVPYVSAVVMPTNELLVSYLDVGQGDGAVIRTPKGHTIVVDAGLEKGKLQVADSLLKLGISKVDWLILSHPHSDHIGGSLSVIEKLKVVQLSYFEGQYAAEEAAVLQTIRTRANENATEFVTLTAGDAYLIEENLTLRVLHPTAQYDSESANDESFVILLSYKNTNFLFTGDISTQVEYDIIGKIPRGKLVLKVPHHGSSTSSSDALTALNDLELAIIQVGQKNRYGHPKPSVLKAYEANRVPVLRNDKNGCIQVISDGNKLWYKLQIQEE